MGITSKLMAAALASNFCALGAFGNPETLVLRSQTDGRMVEVNINYEKYPKIDPPAGMQWSDFDQDTAWTDTNSMGMAVTYVRYHRIFRARLNGVEGLGYDFVHYDGPGSGNDHYSGLFGFNFEDGTHYQAFGVDGQHYRQNSKLPVPNRIVTPGAETYFNYTKYLLPDYQWLGTDGFHLVDRFQGWGQGSAAEHQDGGDIPGGRNGKTGAPPRGFFMPFR